MGSKLKQHPSTPCSEEGGSKSDDRGMQSGRLNKRHGVRVHCVALKDRPDKMLRRLRVAPITSFALTDSLSVVPSPGCPSPHYARFLWWTTGRWAKPRIRNFSVMSAVSSMSAHKTMNINNICIFIINDVIYKIRRNAKWKTPERRLGDIRSGKGDDVSIECHHCHVSNAHKS